MNYKTHTKQKNRSKQTVVLLAVQTLIKRSFPNINTVVKSWGCSTLKQNSMTRQFKIPTFLEFAFAVPRLDWSMRALESDGTHPNVHWTANRT